MAERESITRAAGPFGSLTAADVAKLGEQAFMVAAHMALEERDPTEWPNGAQFAECVAQTFEALLACRAERDGDRFLAVGYTQWAAERLAEVPTGWRPMYEAGRLRREHAKAQRPARARQLAKPATEAGIVESGARDTLAAVTSAWVFGGRSEAQGGGEAPLQSGSPN